MARVTKGGQVRRAWHVSPRAACREVRTSSGAVASAAMAASEMGTRSRCAASSCGAGAGAVVEVLSSLQPLRRVSWGAVEEEVDEALSSRSGASCGVSGAVDDEACLEMLPPVGMRAREMSERPMEERGHWRSREITGEHRDSLGDSWEIGAPAVGGGTLDGGSPKEAHPSPPLVGARPLVTRANAREHVFAQQRRDPREGERV